MCLSVGLPRVSLMTMALSVSTLPASRGHRGSSSTQRAVCGPILKRKVTFESMCQCLSRLRVRDVWNFPGIVNGEKKIN